MATAREKSDWWRTAQLCSLIYNMNRSTKSNAKDPEDFMPSGLVRRRDDKIKISMSDFCDMMKAEKVTK
jgi:hypothetical protein